MCSQNDLEVRVNGWGNSHHRTRDGYVYQNMATPERMASRYERNYSTGEDTLTLYNEDGSPNRVLWRRHDRFGGCGPWRRQMISYNEEYRNNEGYNNYEYRGNEGYSDEEEEEHQEALEEHQGEQATCPLPEEKQDKVDDNEDEEGNKEYNAKEEQDKVDDDKDHKEDNFKDEGNEEDLKDLEDMWSNLHI